MQPVVMWMALEVRRGGGILGLLRLQGSPLLAGLREVLAGLTRQNLDMAPAKSLLQGITEEDAVLHVPAFTRSCQPRDA